MEDDRGMSRPLVSGLAGAATVTLAHEVMRQLVSGAPRMDRLGMAAVSRGLRALAIRPPRGETLRGATLLGDLFTNALYFAPVAARSKRPLVRGTLMGAAMGLATITLTPVLGLPKRHAGRTTRTRALTVGLYALGGLAAGAMALLLQSPKQVRVAD